MSDDIETRLKSALRPVEPREQFTAQLLSQMTLGKPAQAKVYRLDRVRRPLAWWLSASVAASLVLGVGVHQYMEQRRIQQNGLEARRAVLEALRVTSQKLDLAYEAVNSEEHKI